MIRHRTARCLLLFACLAAGPAVAETADELVEKGNAHWLNNELALAEAEYRKAVAADPESVPAHTQLASLYLAQNKTQQAVEAYQAAIMLNPSNASLFVGICLSYLHQGEFSRAHAMCSQALRIDPELANARELKEYIDAKAAAVYGNPPHPGAAGQPPPATPPHR